LFQKQRRNKNIKYGGKEKNMGEKEKKFPYWIHIVLGIVWVVVGIALHAGIELAIWVGGGLVMILIGFFNRE